MLILFDSFPFYGLDSTNYRDFYKEMRLFSMHDIGHLYIQKAFSKIGLYFFIIQRLYLSHQYESHTF